MLANGFQYPTAIDRMQTRKRLYEVIRYEDYNTFDQDIFNFKV